MTYSFLTFFFFIIVVDCLSSSVLLNRLRKHKTITFQSKLSSPIEINLKENSQFHLTCSFLSNFDRIDLFWLHNGTLIQSFISKNIFEEEDDNIDDSFIGVSIVSTIYIEKIHFDINGFYQCVAVHQEIYAQQTFYVHINSNVEINSAVKTNFSTDALITVHTAQALFEPRNYISLICRMSNQQCKTQWFDRNDQSLNILGEKTDLIIKNATFDDHMGLYTCRICCLNHCQKLTSFVYPAAAEVK